MDRMIAMRTSRIRRAFDSEAMDRDLIYSQHAAEERTQGWHNERINVKVRTVLIFDPDAVDRVFFTTRVGGGKRRARVTLYKVLVFDPDAVDREFLTTRVRGGKWKIHVTLYKGRD